MKYNLLLNNLLLLSLFCVIVLNIFSKDNDDEKVIIEEKVISDDSCSDHNPDNDRAAGQCTYNIDCPNGYSCDSFGMCEQKSKTWK